MSSMRRRIALYIFISREGIPYNMTVLHDDPATLHIANPTTTIWLKCEGYMDSFLLEFFFFQFSVDARETTLVICECR